MPTNLAIDDKLLAKAQKIGGYKTKKETVNEALASLIKLKHRQGILSLVNKIDYDPGYNYKEERIKR